MRVSIHHVRWPLQPAMATITANTIPAALHVPGPAGAPLLHFAKRLDVVGWGAERVHIA